MIIQNLKHDLRTMLGSKPWGLPLFAIRQINRGLMVGPGSDIVIEGYPRCANTYSVVAFQQAQPTEVRIAHHLHVPAQILRARDLGIPAIMLIRRPEDAIVSLKLRHPEIDVSRALRDYLVFYGTLTPVAGYPVVADFERVTGDFGNIVDKVNRRFGTDFSLPSADEEFRQAVFDRIDQIRRSANRNMAQIAVPTPEKERMKQESRASVLSELDPLVLDEATSLYLMMETSDSRVRTDG